MHRRDHEYNERSFRPPYRQRDAFDDEHFAD